MSVPTNHLAPAFERVRQASELLRRRERAAYAVFKQKAHEAAAELGLTPDDLQRGQQGVADNEPKAQALEMWLMIQEQELARRGYP